MNKVSFMNELKIFARLVKKHSPTTVGIGAKQLNSHFGTKLKVSDFYELSDKLNLQVHHGKFWYIDEILPQTQENKTKD